jgi:hypothetical protein
MARLFVYAVNCCASSKPKAKTTDEPRQHRLGTDVCFKQSALPAKPGPSCKYSRGVQVNSWMNQEHICSYSFKQDSTEAYERYGFKDPWPNIPSQTVAKQFLCVCELSNVLKFEADKIEISGIH